MDGFSNGGCPKKAASIVGLMHWTMHFLSSLNKPV